MGCAPVRGAGVLLHVGSLPSPYGIGSFGDDARRWVDFLHEAGQGYWQILPLNPTGYGDSPYQSVSAFAGHPYFIDLDTLCQEGLLERPDYDGICWGKSGKRIDYGALHGFRHTVLRKAFSRFTDEAALAGFMEANKWFEDYGMYMAIRGMQGGRPWTQWDTPLRMRHTEAMARVRDEFSEEIRYHAFTQYMFYKQWGALRAYADSKNVRIIGDISIYVSPDSADVWANPHLYQLDENALPIEVAGVPPDGFSSDGQLWGNPLYDWQVMAETGYEWWVQRLETSFLLYDVVRIDHFRGLESYYAVPYGAATAAGGRWKPGPGKDFIDTLKRRLPESCFIAEDLGFLTDEVFELLRYSGFPGMKLLQYAFDSREPGCYDPYAYPPNSLVYPGTHDNDTIKGWGKNAPRPNVRHAMEYMDICLKSSLPRAMIRLAMQSPAYLAVIQMQDWLSLGSEARLNTPSTIGGNNWRWRMKKSDMSKRLAGQMSEIAKLYGRTAI